MNTELNLTLYPSLFSLKTLYQKKLAEKVVQSQSELISPKNAVHSNGPTVKLCHYINQYKRDNTA